jgi:hypothetical protein
MLDKAKRARTRNRGAHIRNEKNRHESMRR